MPTKMNLFRTCLLFGAFFDKVTSSLMDNALSLTEDQMQDLARCVCDDYIYRNEKNVTDCKGSFIEATKENIMFQEPPKTVMRCQSQTMLTVKVVPSQKYKLVIFILPEEKNAYIKPSILYINESITQVDNPSGGRFWSSYLDDLGLPLGWTPGDLAPKWSEPDKKRYDIQIERDFEFRNSSGNLDVVFRWNSSDDATDSCFNVDNQCDREQVLGNMLERSIQPGGLRVFTVQNLQFDDNCTVTVSGKYGKSSLRYETPASCIKFEGFCVPEQPKLYITSERSYSGLGWDVTIRWKKPIHAPIQYNVTLEAYLTHTAIVPADKRNVTFQRVLGERIVGITVVAVGKTKSVVTNERAHLTPLEEPSSIEVLVGGVWSAILLVAVAALLMYVWMQRRRRDKRRDRYFLDLDYKLSKEGSSTTFSTEVTMAEDSWELRPDRLLLHEVIGEGAFGVVRRATLAPGAVRVAVKMLKEFPSVEEIRSFRCEMEVMKSVGAHPHVVSLLGCCSGQRPYIVVEYCHKGNLLHLLRCAWDIMSLKRTAKYYNNNLECGIDYRDHLFKANTHSEHSQIVNNKLYAMEKLCDMELTAVDLLSFCRQIAMGMEFLASNRVVHRDLAARNVLVTNDKTLKIADFGLSRDVYQENQYKQKGLGKLPIKWMALESLTQRVYTTQSDVWSFGVVIWEVVTVGGSPYPGVPASRLPRLLKAGYRMPRPTNCSKQLYDIMQSCWNSRSKERPTFGELHRAFDGLLNCACVDEYLSLELDVDDVPPPPSVSKYFSLLPRKNRYRCSKESYERPLKAPQSNHYTSPPASQPRPQLV